MKSFIRWPVLWWLRFWARMALARVNPFIIGVTGSAGKTSAIEAIRCIAALKFKRVKVAEKANSESGIPADILGLHFVDYSFFDWLRVCLLAPLKFASRFTSFDHESSTPRVLRPEGLRTEWLHASRHFDAYVVEMGIDEPTPPKNMEYLLSILKPHIGVVLNALPVHTQQFERSDLVLQGRTFVEAIASEKGKLITENSNLQIAILNADQTEIASLKPIHNAHVVTFGKNKNADITIESVNPSLAGTAFSFRFKRSDLSVRQGPTFPDSKRLHASRFTLYARHLALPSFYGHTFASALAVGLALGIDPKDACDAMSKNFRLPPGRGQIFEGIKGTTVIDSSYNSSRETMIGSLGLLRTMNYERRTLGD